ncbi:hypothetical protein RRG08_000190 [Elysia crispata]|uniref:N-acetyl-D-glucosamine kinase n=1 Tax=Elysia crispata TaxID=231223 RepID=A0AAE1D532_9GAST|nr:hypothetical protein RRG08_000190 [Elysia crispata]
MSESSFVYFGGIEGGASNTKFVLVRSDGVVLSSSEGKGTNPYMIGLEGCLKRIEALVKEALKNAGLPTNTVLEGLGMSLSGGDEKYMQEQILEMIKLQYASLSQHTFIGSDTKSALATALPEGGVVLIAGTGSNCELINSDGTMARCGGWGHMIGDEASACWISLRAVKTFFDHEDGLVKSKHSIEAVKQTIFNFFKITNRGDMLDHLYKNFDKSKFSELCKELAKVGLEQQDPLCCQIFQEAGHMLGQHLCAIADKIGSDLKTRDGGLPVVCVGSVFKSWKLLERGFIECMRSQVSDTSIHELTLLSLTKDASIGAAVLGARAANRLIPLDYASNANVFYTAKF